MRSLIVIFLLFIICSCKKEEKSIVIDDAYKAEFAEYKKKGAENRINYLQLTGLFQFNSGENTFGKNSSNAFALDIEGIPETIGTYTLDEEKITFITADSVKVSTEDGVQITKNAFALDKLSEAPRLYLDRLNWVAILRSGKYYLRVWDTLNPMVETFKGFELYDLNPDYIFEADFSYFDVEKTEEVHSQLGVNASTKFIGRLAFEYQGKTHHLDVGSSGFTMVHDETSGEETYGGGRYIYLDLPEKDGKVTIDFNRLYNPPCSFSKFTTCLYPPQQNHLPFKLEAGEKLKRK